MKKEAELQGSITRAIAEAIDLCINKFTSPKEADMAANLGQKVIAALTGGEQSSKGSRTSATATRTWADVARTPKAPVAGKGATSASQSGASKHGSQGTPKKDPRIFIEARAEVRLKRHTPFAIRQAICQNINNIELKDIPTASEIKTGWAITPASEEIKQRLLTEENQALLLKAVDGEHVKIPEAWVNYAVQGVASSYPSLVGTYTPTTRELVQTEAASQTGAQPVSCKISRHGANSSGFATWIISFQQSVRPFRLFGTSNFAQVIKKRPVIQRHDPGCQGFCNPVKCRRMARCSNCSKQAAEHEGPIGADCQQKVQCANCHGPFKSGHPECPAAPTRAQGKIIRLSKKELIEVQRVGRRAFRQVHNLVESEQQATAAPTSQPQSAAATPELQSATATPDPPTSAQVPAPTQETELSQTQSSAANGRAKRAATRKRNLNIQELSAQSMAGQETVASSSAVVEENVAITDIDSTLQ